MDIIFLLLINLEVHGGSRSSLLEDRGDGLYYISITIVQSYTGKYHKVVAVCIVTSVQHE